MKTDKNLGMQLNAYLKEKGVESPLKNPLIDSGYNMKQYIRAAVTTIIKNIGYDPESNEVRDTPNRVADMYIDEVFCGLDYDNFPKCTDFEVGDINNSQMVMVAGIEVKSMCEHHFMPIRGKCTIAYIPKKNVMGLSKFSRIVNFFSRRPQLQERLTLQIAHTLSFILKTEDIAVFMKAEHFCMSHRGPNEHASETVTSYMGGRFMEEPALRNEFLQMKG